jgi:hypothetical protein
MLVWKEELKDNRSEYTARTAALQNRSRNLARSEPFLPQLSELCPMFPSSGPYLFPLHACGLRDEVCGLVL